jgi:hypothetical protein
MYACMYMCMYMRIYVYMYYVYILLYVCICVGMYAYICVYMCVCVRICVYMCAYVYIYIYISVYMCVQCRFATTGGSYTPSVSHWISPIDHPDRMSISVNLMDDAAVTACFRSFSFPALAQPPTFIIIAPHVSLS